MTKRKKADTALKVVDEKLGVIKGLGIPFAGPIDGKDLEGDYFDDRTDLALDWFPNDGRPLLYDHGLEQSVKASVVGRQIGRELEPEVGHWAKVQLNMAHRYAEAVLELAGEGALGFSSGAMKHLVEKESDGHIARWPWVELSLTPVPANPYGLIAPDAVKHLTALGLEPPDPLRELLEAVKRAVGVHHTETSDAPWDRGQVVASIPNDAGASAFGALAAWQDADGDSDVKESYRFWHHFYSGGPGAASTPACSNGIGVLNGGRGGTTIPDADRQGVYNHLAAHLRDADMEPPALRALSGVKFFDQAEHVRADVQALVERARSLADLRAQEGRSLSDPAYKALVAVKDELETLLREAEPMTKRMERELAQYEAIVARLHGVAA